MNMAAAKWKNVVTTFSHPVHLSSGKCAVSYSKRTELITKYNKELYKKNYKYILDDRLAKRVVRCLGPLHEDVIVETNPGPGILTAALFQAGARQVIGLEPERKFHPALWKLKAEVATEMRFDILHGDFSKIDPHGGTVEYGASCTPPAIPSKDVMKNIQPQPWESDSLAARFVGIESATNPTVLPRVLMGHLSKIAAREGIFQNGRCELAFFYAEDRAKKITAQFGSKYYNRLAVMVALFCDVKVLLQEPCSLFDPFLSKEKHKCLTLVSIIPKKNPAVNIAGEDLHYLNYFVRLLMAKPHRRVLDAIEGICPGGRVILDDIQWPHSTVARDLSPQDIGTLASAFFRWEGRSLNFFYDVGCNEADGMSFM